MSLGRKKKTKSVKYRFNAGRIVKYGTSRDFDWRPATLMTMTQYQVAHGRLGDKTKKQLQQLFTDNVMARRRLMLLSVKHQFQ